MTGPINPIPDPFTGRGALHANDEVLAQRADQLNATVQALRNAVASLDERAGHVEERATATETKATKLTAANRRSVVALAIVAGFLLICGYLVVNNRATTARLENSVRQQCSLYGLLIPSFRGAPPPGSPLGEQQYRNAYVQMQDSADSLGCGIKHVVPGT